jgi:cobalt-zinc-cadmium efflux system protein
MKDQHNSNKHEHIHPQKDSCDHDHSHNDDHHHDHDHGHDHSHEGSLHIHPVVKNMRVALVLNTFFTVIEFVGGIYTNSIAILSDAIHDLGDSIAIAASLFLEKQAGKGRTTRFSYGKRRFSTLAAFITSLILLVGSVIILIEAIPRFLTVEPVKTNGVLWLAVLGILFNGLALLRLRKGNQNSLNQRAVMLHLVEDALGWIAVLAGAVIMYFTHWYWIDPLLSVGIAAFVFYNAFRNILAVLKIFLQATPSSFDAALLTSALKQLPDVVNVHDLHCWTMDGENNVCSLHLVVKPSMDISRLNVLLQKATAIITAQNIQHPTIQVETEGIRCGLVSC